MSDDFDKEAEREKLREKYERDQQKRQATEQMSELLLKGATMTNAHCSDCGDPIFRYDDQEFCPTCEKPVERDTGDEEDTEEGDQNSEEIEVTTPSDEARVAFGDDANGADSDGTGADTPDPAGAADAAAEGEAQAQDTSQQAQQSSAAESAEPGLPAQHEQELPSTEQAETDRGRRRADANAHVGERESARGEASVTAARESLVVTLTRFSRLAEQTEDPRQAQEYLAAAREAAATLAELRR